MVRLLRHQALLLWLGCCWVLGVTAVPMNTGFNLLSNPGFEHSTYEVANDARSITGTLAGGFNENTDWAGDRVELSYFISGDTAALPPRSGSKAQCVTVSKGFAQVVQWLELPTGRNYSLTLWVRVSSATTTTAAAAAAVSSAVNNDEHVITTDTSAVDDIIVSHSSSSSTTTTSIEPQLTVTVPVQLGLIQMGGDYELFGTTDVVQVPVSAGWVQLVVPPVELPTSLSATAAAAAGSSRGSGGASTSRSDSRPGGSVSSSATGIMSAARSSGNSARSSSSSTSDSSTPNVGFMFWVLGPGTGCFDDGTLYESIDLELGGPDDTDADKLQNPDFEDGFYGFDSAPADISGTMAYGSWGDNTDWSPGASLRYKVVNDEAQSGSQSIAIQVLSGFAQFVQWKTVQVGTAYKLSIWARGVPDDSDGTAVTITSDAEKITPSSAAAAAEIAASTSDINAGSSSAAAAAAGAGSTITSMSVMLSVRMMQSPYTVLASATVAVGDQWVQLTVPEAVVPWNVAGAGGQALQVGFMVNIGGKGTVWLDNANLELIQDLSAVTVTTVPKARIPRSYLGMNIAYLHEKDGREYVWPVLDFGWFRTWGTGVMWASIQKDGPSSWDWSDLDKDLVQLKARRQKMMFTLGQTPTWASSEPDKPDVYGYGYGSVPTNVEDWKRFVRELLKRCGSFIAAVEVWNEPNLQGPDGFFNGTPEQLALLALATQQVLKELGHKALLVNPPMSGMGSDAVDFLQRYFTESRRLGVVHTAVSWHSYNVPPEADLQSVRVLRGVMAGQGLPAGLPIFNTEAGILPEDFAMYDNSHSWFGAGFLARTYVVNWAAGVSTLYWFAYNEYEMEGLTSTTREQQQPEQLNDAGRAYNNVVAALTNARMLSLTRSSAGIWTAALLKGTSSRSWIMWNGDQRVASKQVRVPAAAKTRQDLVTGERVSLKKAQSQQIMVTFVPVLLLA